MRQTYAAIVRQDAPGEAYSIHFPDLPGATTSAPTLDDVHVMASEAAQLAVDFMSDEGLTLPEPSDFGAVSREATAAGAVGTLLVPVRLPGKAKRINISMDEHLLEDIDRAATARGMNRSAFLAEAARRFMADVVRDDAGVDTDAALERAEQLLCVLDKMHLIPHLTGITTADEPALPERIGREVREMQEKIDHILGRNPRFAAQVRAMQEAGERFMLDNPKLAADVKAMQEIAERLERDHPELVAQVGTMQRVAADVAASMPGVQAIAEAAQRATLYTMRDLGFVPDVPRQGRAPSSPAGAGEGDSPPRRGRVPKEGERARAPR